MIDYGLKGRVVLITGVNNPQGIGAATALAFAREGAKLVLVYKKVDRPFDKDKTGKNGVDRYYAANAGDADHLERLLREMDAEYLILERDISDENAVKDIYTAAVDRFGRVDILVNNAAVDDENGLDTIEKITQNVIDDTFAVNVRGSVLMIRELVGHQPFHGRCTDLRGPDHIRSEQGDARSAYPQHCSRGGEVWNHREQRCPWAHTDRMDR